LLRKQLSSVADGGRVRLDALTGLRFVAAAMIVAEHAHTLRIPVPEYALGHGVSFFFVLSGFIIAYAYPRLDSGRAVFGFMVSRVARIWPAHFIALLLTIWLLRLPSDPATFVANALLLHGWIPSWPWYFSYNAPSWTISTELFFYVAFPVLIFHWRTTWWWKWLLSALLVVALIGLVDVLHLAPISDKDEVTAHGLLYVNPLGRLFEFVTGMVVCSVYRWLLPQAARLSVAAFTALEILIISLAAYSVGTGLTVRLLIPLFHGTGMQWLGQAADVLIFPFVILIFACGRGWLSRCLGNAPMVLLGDMSYSIYLLHLTIFDYYYICCEVDHVAPDYAGVALSVAVILAMAFIILTFVEAPFRRAAKQWLRKKSKFTSPTA
jgi:peptidoglycan/LPS O-acetylase OafA/YrhL